MKVLLLGDSHGDKAFVNGALDYAAADGLDAVVQMGDFGYWPRTNNGQKFLHDVGKHSASTVPLYWIDGNHEDHLELATLTKRPGEWHVMHGKYPIFHIRRGATWTWGNMRFGAFGGAYSIDRNMRVEDDGHYGWFRGEMPDPTVIEGLMNVDVLLTHDSPIVPPMMHGAGFKTDATSTLSQHYVRCALNASGAALLVHGHWHLNERYEVDGAIVQGLAMNHDSLYDAAAVIDTESKKFYTLREWEYRDV